MSPTLIVQVLTILAAGLVAGVVCRRIGVSVLVGYLVVGAMIGPNTLGLVGHADHDMEHLAEAGVLLLLFSIGLEFSLEDLTRMGRDLLIGGAVQMLLVSVPAAIGLKLMLGVSWQAAVLMGLATSLSSTVLVFKALAEWGQTATPHGRRAVGILLFQDVALVPLLLLIPLLTGTGEAAGWREYALLAAESIGLIAGIVLGRWLIGRFVVPLLAALRSPDLVVLFTLLMLGTVVLIVYKAGLPLALGAFAAGLMFSDNRLTSQVDAVVLPMRETCSAVFFVGLGTLFQPQFVAREAGFLLFCLAGVLLLKSTAAAAALRITGVSWRAAWGTGVGLAQLGEFSFVLALAGRQAGLVGDADYQRLLTLALATFLLTPQLLRSGLRWIGAVEPVEATSSLADRRSEPIELALVIGAGPVGRQVASRLEMSGVEVCLIDLSPVNLHPFAQQGFLTVTGDAADIDVLQRARIERAQLVAICIPSDPVALQVARTVRSLNGQCRLLARCRYLSTATQLRRAGADAVVTEEVEASDALLRSLAQLHEPNR